MPDSSPAPRRPARRRKVADLNEEQKQRKRVVDRQAQQAFRERSKAQIQDLEEEVETLHRQASENEDIWRHENARLRKQVERLSQRLRQIRDLTGISAAASLDLAQEHSSGDSDTRMGHAVATSTPAEPTVDVAPDAAAHGLLTTDCSMSNAALDVIQNGHNDNEGVVTQLTSVTQRSFSRPRDIDQDSTMISAVEGENSFTQNELPQMNQGVEPSNISHVTTAYEPFTESSLLPVFLATPHSTHTAAAHIGPPVSIRRREVHDTTCDHSQRTCPFDHILVNYMEAMRASIARGEPVSSAIGPPEPDIVGLFQPERAAQSHQLSRMLVEMMLTFAHVDNPERLAFMYKIHKMMRVSGIPEPIRAYL